MIVGYFHNLGKVKDEMDWLKINIFPTSWRKAYVIISCLKISTSLMLIVVYKFC